MQKSFFISSDISADKTLRGMVDVLDDIIESSFRTFSIFRNISDEEVKYFQEITKEVKISKGDIFISEGSIGDSIYMLVEGEVEVNQALTLSLNRKGNDNREKALIKLNSNQTPPPLFGEMSLFNDDDKRTANVKALTDCHLFKIMKEDFFPISIP